MQGCGVRTPNAAAVAAATCGLARLLHIPHDEILTMGAASVMTSMGLPSAKTVILFVDVRFPGVVPKLHMHIAPVVTTSDIAFSF